MSSLHIASFHSCKWVSLSVAEHVRISVDWHKHLHGTSAEGFTVRVISDRTPDVETVFETSDKFAAVSRASRLFRQMEREHDSAFEVWKAEARAKQARIASLQSQIRQIDPNGFATFEDDELQDEALLRQVLANLFHPDNTQPLF